MVGFGCFSFEDDTRSLKGKSTKRTVQVTGHGGEDYHPSYTMTTLIKTRVTTL